MRSRHVGNNWFPLLGLALLFLAAGALTTMSNSGYGSAPRFFAVGTMVWAVASAVWWWLNPSWWLAPRKHLLYLAAGTLAGVLLSSMVPFLRGCGPWLVLGAALTVFGVFERTRILITTGAVVAFTGLLAALVTADVWGGAMHLISTAVLTFTANKLYALRNGRRREAQDAAPDFIGSFEDVESEDIRSD